MRPERASAAAWMTWRAAECLAHRGRWMRLEKASELPQVIRTEKDLDGSQLELMRELWDASREGAAAAKAQAYDRERKLLLDRLGEQRSSWSADEIDEWVDARIKDVNSAEAGAWRITTGTGDFIVTMSSGNYGEIESASVQAALNQVLAKPTLEWRDIRSVEFWHTHPTTLSPLSVSDGRAFNNFVRALRAAGIHAPVTMFAITQLDGLWLAFAHATGA